MYISQTKARSHIRSRNYQAMRIFEASHAAESRPVQYRAWKSGKKWLYSATLVTAVVAGGTTTFASPTTASSMAASTTTAAAATTSASTTSTSSSTATTTSSDTTTTTASSDSTAATSSSTTSSSTATSSSSASSYSSSDFATSAYSIVSSAGSKVNVDVSSAGNILSSYSSAVSAVVSNINQVSSYATKSAFSSAISPQMSSMASSLTAFSSAVQVYLSDAAVYTSYLSAASSYISGTNLDLSDITSNFSSMYSMASLAYASALSMYQSDLDWLILSSDAAAVNSDTSLAGSLLSAYSSAVTKITSDINKVSSYSSVSQYSSAISPELSSMASSLAGFSSAVSAYLSDAAIYNSDLSALSSGSGSSLNIASITSNITTMSSTASSAYSYASAAYTMDVDWLIASSAAIVVNSEADVMYSQMAGWISGSDFINYENIASSLSTMITNFNNGSFTASDIPQVYDLISNYDSALAILQKEASVLEPMRDNLYSALMTFVDTGRTYNSMLTSLFPDATADQEFPVDNYIDPTTGKMTVSANDPLLTLNKAITQLGITGLDGESSPSNMISILQYNESWNKTTIGGIGTAGGMSASDFETKGNGNTIPANLGSTDVYSGDWSPASVQSWIEGLITSFGLDPSDLSVWQTYVIGNTNWANGSSTVSIGSKPKAIATPATSSVKIDTKFVNPTSPVATPTPIGKLPHLNFQNPTKPVTVTKKTIRPSIDIEKTNDALGAAGNGNNTDVNNNDGPNDHDTAATADQIPNGQDTPIYFHITNNGVEPLTDVKATDVQISGQTRVGTITWSYHGTDLTVNAAGYFMLNGKLFVLMPGDSIIGRAELPALIPGELVGDKATVSGVGVISGIHVSDSDTWWGETPKPGVPSKPVAHRIAQKSLPHTGDETSSGMTAAGEVMIGIAITTVIGMSRRKRNAARSSNQRKK